MKRKKRSNEELQASSKHLFYEYSMFVSLARGMASGIFQQGIINNALLESFTIHVRTLLDFLYATEKAKPDDVIAEDYFQKPEEWHQKRPPKTELLQGVHRRVGKEIAHLSYVRLSITQEEKQWHFVKITNDVNSVVNQFASAVPPHLLFPEWKEHPVDKAGKGSNDESHRT
ncbi:MAG: hypothetical protein HY781_11460 [Chloroflexi bacterium]|nr:hypothetical protein [Chloroflexota bacterium]